MNRYKRRVRSTGSQPRKAFDRVNDSWQYSRVFDLIGKVRLTILDISQLHDTRFVSRTMSADQTVGGRRSPPVDPQVYCVATRYVRSLVFIKDRLQSSAFEEEMDE